MTAAGAILATLVSYKILLILIGLWAQRRTHDSSDFFLGGRALGPLVAAISASASSSSAWTLLGVSGAAYGWGLAALWLFPATLLGFVFNWFWVAPRLMPASRRSGALTLPEFIAGQGQRSAAILRTCSAIIVFSFLFYIAAQFQAAGEAFAAVFGLDMRGAVAIGAAVVLLYTLLGGFWAVSVTDTLQGLLMASTAVVLPLGALLAVGGWGRLLAGLGDAAGEALTFSGAHAGIAAVGFVAGTLGIGLGYPGQPHVVNRFMALRDQGALRQAQYIAVGWAVIVYSGMLLLGWCARVLVGDMHSGEQVFFVVAAQVFPPVVAGIMIAAVLSAIMSTADSQLLVVSSSLTHDLRQHRTSPGNELSRTRVVVTVITLAAMLLAMFAPDTIFRRVLFAWHAVGSAFGPALLLRLAGLQLRSGFVLASIVSGFGATVALHWPADTPGDFAERLLPFALALAIAWTGRRRYSSDPGSH